jgi:hypothetical protein
LYGDTQLILANPKEVEELLVANSAPLEKLQSACDLPTAESRQMYTSDRKLSEYRALSKLLAVQASQSTAKRELATALDAIHKQVALADRSSEIRPLLLSALVGTGINALATGKLKRLIAQRRRFDVDDQHRRALVELQMLLLNDRPTRQAYIAGLIAERRGCLNILDDLISGRTTLQALNAPLAGLGMPLASQQAVPVPRVLLTPLWNREAQRTLDEITACLNALRVKDYPSAARLLPPEQPETDVPRWLEPYSLRSFVSGSPRRTVSHPFREMADRRLAGTAIALWLYELDHGRLPDSLRALVPNYLESVPLDPLGEPGSPLGYLPFADPPALYSVGENGVDHGGTFDVDEEGSMLLGSPDRPFLLKLPELPPLPDEQAADAADEDD